MFSLRRMVVLIAIATFGASVLMAGMSLRALQAQGRPPERQRWEYRSVQMVTAGSAGWKAQLSDGTSIENVDSDITGISTVNRLGQSGWEVISVVHEKGNSVEYFLKRPLR